jgi:hypothetical protein
MYMDLCQFVWIYVNQNNIIWISKYLHEYEHDFI